MSLCTCDLWGVASCPTCCTHRQGVEAIVPADADVAAVVVEILDSWPSMEVGR